MARRRSNKGGLIEDLSMLPWWVSVTISVFIFIFLKFILPNIGFNSPILQGITIVLPNMAFFIAAIFLLPALASFLRDLKNIDKQPSLSKPVKSAQRNTSAKFKGKAAHTERSQAEPANTLSEITVNEKPVAWAEKLLKKLEWKRFEELCCAYFEVKGFTSKTTGVGADGGIDIKLYKNDLNHPAVLVQCKAWSTKKIGVKTIRELFGVMASEGVNQGVVMGTGEFTEDAREFAKKNKIVLASGRSLFKEITKLPVETQISLLNVATEGDYMTPTCASCDVKMVLRKKKNSDSAGNEFWGCVNFPRCRSLIYT